VTAERDGDVQRGPGQNPPSHYLITLVKTVVDADAPVVLRNECLRLMQGIERNEPDLIRESLAQLHALAREHGIELPPWPDPRQARFRRHEPCSGTWCETTLESRGVSPHITSGGRRFKLLLRGVLLASPPRQARSRLLLSSHTREHVLYLARRGWRRSTAKRMASRNKEERTRGSSSAGRSAVAVARSFTRRPCFLLLHRFASLRQVAQPSRLPTSSAWESSAFGL
jgi:hypothetical protein